MARKLFGTDGIRGTANSNPVTAEIAMAVAKAAGSHFTRGDHRHTVVIGKDTRLSGYLLEPALTAGFIAVGMDVILLGPVPTPAVGMLTRSMRADMGVMISASHNPYQDNGIKLFGPDGFKLNDAVEAEIEALVEDPSSIALAPSEKLGRARRLDDAAGRYIEFVKNSFPRDLRLDGLKIVVDCANGAAYKVAPTVLYELGAEVIPVAVQPDGFNINKNCGATAPGTLREAVVTHNADFGIALDGDADRLIMVDEKGQVIDGDQVMALIAKTLHQSGQLKGNGVVATVMSNMGLENYLKELGLDLIRTSVGDRYVLEEMRKSGYNLGGEQSGHMILSDHATTGDGLMAALQVIAAILRDGRKASEVMRAFEPYPQILKNVRISSGQPLDEVLDLSQVREAIDEGGRSLEGSGRVLIRKSGTEPVIRVMAEGRENDQVNAVVDRIKAVIEQAADA
ncbi:phosphoglucosamine mutase [Kiloniella sp. b19]|uniref:phosphoglucosamine mutase n=1 Tax=Kiloniella sp. GXU_MW_B19 TaxID=3141326 RepID=UPI0031E2B033